MITYVAILHIQEFSCVSCPYKTKYESEIIYHSKKKCKDTSDTEDNVEEKEENEEKEEQPNEPTLEKPIPERRISTRVKKRKYIFDLDDFVDDRKRRKKNKDDDFKPTEETGTGTESPEDDDDDDSDYGGYAEKRSRNKRKY